MTHFRLALHPAGVLGVLSFAFVAWLVSDATSAPSAPSEPDGVPPTHLKVRREPPPVEFQPIPLETAPLLSKLSVGMTRNEVEALIGQPVPNSVQPPLTCASRGTSFLSYEIELEPTSARATQPRPCVRITLEFDVTQHEHPLVGIHGPRI